MLTICSFCCCAVLFFCCCFYSCFMVFIHYYAVSLICILALPAETCVSVQRQQQRQRTASQLCTRPDFMRFLNFLLYCARLDRPLPLLARLQSPFFFLLFFFILFSTENFLALLSLFTFECVYMLPNTHTYIHARQRRLSVPSAFDFYSKPTNPLAYWLYVRPSVRL